MKKVVCTHLFNDFSGSPLILSTVIKGLLQKGVSVDLITSSEEEGFLSKLSVNYSNNQYRFYENKLVRIFFFFVTQIISFFKTWTYRKEDVVVYVNTLLPFGVAIAGKLMNKKVVYHIHETSVKPAILKRFLKWVAANTASEIIYVSDFLRKQEPIGEVPSKVIYNALSQDFVKTAQLYQNQKKRDAFFTILMLCSLKDYKGVREFVDVASALPDLSFELVLNAEMEAIHDFFKDTVLPENLILFSKQSNVHPFYQRANVVVNLSHPELWVETFGMTLLEGMEYGIPAISPPVGGCTEFVQHGINGYQLDQRHLQKIITQIKLISTNPSLYQQLSNNARKMAQNFKVESMCLKVFNTIQ